MSGSEEEVGVGGVRGGSQEDFMRGGWRVSRGLSRTPPGENEN